MSASINQGLADKPKFGVCFGTDGTYLSEAELSFQFKPFGFTPDTFREFWTGLGMGGIQMPDGDVLLNYHVFKELLWYLTSFRPGLYNPLKDKVDKEPFLKCWRKVLSEMLLSKRLVGGSTCISERALYEKAIASLSGAIIQHIDLERATARAAAVRSLHALRVTNPQEDDRDRFTEVPLPRPEEN